MVYTIAQQDARTRTRALLRRSPEAMDRALDKTAEIWRGRKIDPIKYQRRMRKSYATEGLR